ncbi:hypothetical protein QJQ45_022752 [Haematococcus lacustris]|nr:hypothetical protein QJQ45_022752 [Haematococcus lacustris]
MWLGVTPATVAAMLLVSADRSAQADTKPLAYIALYPDARWQYRAIPGPVGLPLVGNLLSILGQGRDITSYMQECGQRYGPVFKIWFGCKPWVFVAEPEAAKRLMSRLMARPSLRGFALMTDSQAHIIDQGLLTLNGPAWRVARKAFEAVVMHKDTVALHLEVMEQCVARLLARLARATAAGGGDGAIVNVAPLMGDLTMDVVGSCVFGVAFNTQEADLGLTAGRQLFTSGEEGAGSLTLPHTPQELVEACHFFFAAGGVATRIVVQQHSGPGAAAADGACRRLACLLPDEGQRKTLHCRQVIIDTCKALIAAWEQDHPPPAATAQGMVLATTTSTTSTTTLPASADAAAAAAAAPPIARKPHTSCPSAPGHTPLGAVLRSERSFLGLLLGARSDLAPGITLDKDQVIAQVFTFLLAGYETTAAALTFALYLLAANPEAQRKLQAEVDSQAHLLAPRKGPSAAQELNGGDHKQGNGIMVANGAGQAKAVLVQAKAAPDLAPAIGPVLAEPVRAGQAGKPHMALSSEELARSFPYTCAVVDEALRLYPSAATTIRTSAEELEVAGLRIPANTFLHMPLFSFHRDPAVWPDACAFKPERHLGEHATALDARAKVSYMPFGHGGRWCPGQRFALQEERLALVRLFSHFSLELAPMQEHPVQLRSGASLAPVNGIWVRVRPRG